MLLKSLCLLILTSIANFAIAQTTPAGKTFSYVDGGKATYYKFQLSEDLNSKTFVFFYGGTGCVDFKPYIPDFFRGIDPGATIFALNKRAVLEGSTPKSCAEDFPAYDLPNYWFADYMEFISAQLSASKITPKNVVLVGISEGAYPAIKVARSRGDVTHLVIIGDGGGWTMRQSLEKLVGHDYVEDGWRTIAADANSLTQTWLGRPYRWWLDIIDIDSKSDYLSLNIPILMGHGEKDQSVPIESALALQKAFEDAGKANLKLHVYPGVGHTLTSDTVDYRKQLFEELSQSLAH